METLGLSVAGEARVFIEVADVAGLAHAAVDEIIAGRVDSLDLFTCGRGTPGVAIGPAREGEAFARPWAVARGLGVTAECTLCRAMQRCTVHGGTPSQAAQISGGP